MPSTHPFEEQSSSPNSPIKAAFFMAFAIIVSVCGMFAAANSYGNANHNQQPGKKHKGPDFNVISAQLQLTDEQTSQLKATLRSHHESRRQAHSSLKQKHHGEKRETRESHKQALDAELTEFLSEDQITDLHEILEKNRPPRPCKVACGQHTASNKYD